MNEQIFWCSEGHYWYEDGQDSWPFRACPSHDGLPFHNGPDDRFAQEDE